MVTDVDLWAIKEQIVNVLDSDTDLFDATGARGKIRKVTVGAPRMDRLKKETTLPQIWVTNDNIIDDIKNATTTQANAYNLVEHTLHFRLILLEDAKDGPKAEEKLDDFVQLINQTIGENYDLRDPGGAEVTSVVDSCRVIQVLEFPGLSGLAKAGRIIRLLAVKTSS